MDKELLQTFCGTYPRCLVPWSDGEFTYATDAMTLIRVPRLPDVPEVKNPYNVESLYKGAELPLDGWLDLPGLDMLGQPAACPKCQGKANDNCLECNGEGVVKYWSGFHDYENECQSCDGEGEAGYCRECKGTGVIEVLDSIELGGSSFTTAFLRKFHTLPGCKIAPPTQDGKFAWLKFDGGDGLTMPRVKAQKEWDVAHA